MCIFYPNMDITTFIIQSIITLVAFIMGAFVYHKGTMVKPPLSLDLNKEEIQRQPEWDQL